MEARAGGAVHRLALEWSGPAFAKLRRGEGWNRLELAKSGPSDVSLEAASGIFPLTIRAYMLILSA
jgi:hypothetical protein